MHVAWSYCQAVGFVAKRKRNQLEQFKKEESADESIWHRSNTMHS